MREASEYERMEVLRFYKDSTEDDYEDFRIGVLDDYTSDCPGYCGPLYILIGGHPGAYQLLGRGLNGLFSFEKECAF